MKLSQAIARLEDMHSAWTTATGAFQFQELAILQSTMSPRDVMTTCMKIIRKQQRMIEQARDNLKRIEQESLGKHTEYHAFGLINALSRQALEKLESEEME